MATNQYSTSLALKTQRWVQISLAVFLTSFFVLLLPGAGMFLVPLGCLYIVWAYRASSDHKISIWLAFAFTLSIALLGGLAISQHVSSLMNNQQIPMIDASIELILFVLAATAVILHGLNWRWLFAPANQSPFEREHQAPTKPSIFRWKSESVMFLIVILTGWAVLLFIRGPMRAWLGG